MAKIIAKGKWGGEVMTVICTEAGGRIKFTFNGREDDLLKEMLEGSLDMAPAMGGTYYPEKPSIG